MKCRMYAIKNRNGFYMRSVMIGDGVGHQGRWVPNFDLLCGGTMMWGSEDDAELFIAGRELDLTYGGGMEVVGIDCTFEEVEAVRE